MKLNIVLLVYFVPLLFDLAYTIKTENDFKRNITTVGSKLPKISEKTNYPKKVATFKKKSTKLTALQQETNFESKTAKINWKKESKPITEVFKDLPADDLAFIKDLDKQFNLHGGKIKIKIENDNSSVPKNSKRTIDGELGYGYSQNGYNYEAPKYEFYPYSQHDIPASQEQNQGEKQTSNYYLPPHQSSQEEKVRTEVSIEPSYSYELKSHDYYEQPQIDLPASGQPNEHPQQQQQEQQPHQQPLPTTYEEPVIVLRIPGPTKYAAHLQALLQQYLEIRAAQYLQILEAHEKQQSLQEQNYHDDKAAQAQQQQQQHHAPIDHHAHQPYAQPQDIAHHQEAQRQPEYYATGPTAPQTEYKHGPSSQKLHTNTLKIPHHPYHKQYYQNHPQIQQHQQYQQQQQQVGQHGQAEPQQYAYYNEISQTYQVPTEPGKEAVQYYYTTGKENYHTSSPVVYLVPMIPAEYAMHHQPMQPIYVPESQKEQQSLPITENNPRPTHTQVYFKSQPQPTIDTGAHTYQIVPSAQPYEHHTPVTQTNLYQTYYEPQQQTEQYVTPQVDVAHVYGNEQEVVITQRPQKYGGHKARVRGRRRNATNAPKTTTTASTVEDPDEQHLSKIRNFVREKYGAQTGTSEELPVKSNKKKV